MKTRIRNLREDNDLTQKQLNQISTNLIQLIQILN